MSLNRDPRLTQEKKGKTTDNNMNAAGWIFKQTCIHHTQHPCITNRKPNKQGKKDFGCNEIYYFVCILVGIVEGTYVSTSIYYILVMWL